MKKIISTAIATIAICLVASVAYASYQSKDEILIKQFNKLIEIKQEEWEKLDKEHQATIEYMNGIMEEKVQIEEEAKLYRETIAVLQNKPVGVDTTDFQ